MHKRVPGCGRHTPPIHAGMRIEALILGQDDGPLESGGDILQGKPIAAPYLEIGAYAFDQLARAIQHLDIRSHCVGFDLVVRRRLREGRCRSRQGKQRSEEHTSELQSLMRISYAVFCLKKKKKKQKQTNMSIIYTRIIEEEHVN